jgi:hypothetical protein
MKKAGAHPSATGFMRSKPWQISVPARKQLRFNMKIPNHNNTHDDTHIHVKIIKNQHGKNVYVIDGTPQKTLTLHLGKTYTFTYPPNHPLHFSETSDGSHSYGNEFTVGVVRRSNHTLIFSVLEPTPNTLYYYCGLHSGMGGKINIIKPLADVTCQGTIPCTIFELSGCVIPQTNYCCSTNNWVDGAGCTDGSTDSVCHITSVKNQLAGDTCLDGRDFRDCSSSAPYVPDFPTTCPSGESVPQCPQGQSYQLEWNNTGCVCKGPQGGAGPCAGPADILSKDSYRSASIKKLNDGDISLCPQFGPCAGLLVSEKDMDKLAEIIARGTQKQSNNAIDILNEVAERYITQTVENNTCASYYYKNSGNLAPSKGSWATCQKGSCVSYASKKFAVNEVSGGQVDSVGGCGWWGRGVIQTTGPGNFGTLQQALNKIPKYQNNFNLCKTPDLICNTTKWPELRWLAGFIYWLSEVQGEWPSPTPGDPSWNYFTELSGVAYGDVSFNDFVDATSGLVNRGCPATVCPAGAVHGLNNRQDNANVVSKILFNAKLNTQGDVPTNIYDLLSGEQKGTIEDQFKEKVFKTLAQGVHQPYTYDGLLTAFELITNGNKLSDDPIHGFFYEGSGDSYSLDIGIIALSAFLGQCMQETLQYGACDENNWSSGFAKQCSPANYGPGGCGDEHDAYPSVALLLQNMCSCKSSPPPDKGTAQISCPEEYQVKTEEDCDTSGACRWDVTTNSCIQNIYGSRPTQAPKPDQTVQGYEFYPNTSSCGQLGQYYKAYRDKREKAYNCPTDTVDKRTMVASTNAQFAGAPPQLYSVPTTDARKKDLYHWTVDWGAENNSTSLQNIASRARFTGKEH